MTEKHITRLQKAVKLEEVPTDRMAEKVKSTIIGTLFNALGGYGLFIALHAFQETKELSTPLVLGASAFLLIGSTMWSKQLVVGSLMALRQPFKAWKTLTGKDDVA